MQLRISRTFTIMLSLLAVINQAAWFVGCVVPVGHSLVLTISPISRMTTEEHRSLGFLFHLRMTPIKLA